MSKPENRLWSLWGVPLFLNILLGFGLACALLGDGTIWRVLAWVLLAVPIGVAGYYSWRRHH